MRLCLLIFCAAAALYGDSAAGLRWTAPAGWKNEGSRPMRAATYAVGDAECAVYFFGSGQGGSVEANLARWQGQFHSADSKPVDTHVRHRKVHGLAVTTVDMTGAYSGMGGPMVAEKKTLTGYRMLGAIVEGPGGNLFIKFTGPAKTIAANQQKFEHLLASFTKE